MKSNLDQFRGNTNLKKPGFAIDWTPDLIEEYVKCSRDPIYFGENYFTIVTGAGRERIKMYDYQKELILSCVERRHTIAEMARQSGKSTAITVFALWYILFNQDKTVALAANKGDTAREILGRIQLAYEHLPKWLQQGVREWNKGSFILENGSRILAAATSSDTLRGYSINVLLIDEAAHVDHWEEFFASMYPTITQVQGKIVLISTVYGLNHFYEFTSQARKGLNDYNLISVHWNRVPGRDEKWKEEALSGMNYDYERFAQEFENEYLGSSGTLIAGWKLKELSVSHKEPQIRQAGIYQYIKPQSGRKYILVADTARGKGLDYSAFQIIDVTEMPYQQACVYRDNLITPIDFAEVIHRMAKTYHNALCLIENNDIGQQVADLIYFDYEYEQVLQTESAGRMGRRISMGFGTSKSERGIRTTKTVKSVGCSIFKMLVEQDQLCLYDRNTLDEIFTFAKKGDSYTAESGKTDDLVMCLVLFGWLSNQDFFRELTDINTLVELREKSDEDIMSALVPFGVIEDHNMPDTLPSVSHSDPWSLADPYDTNEGF